MENRTLLQNRSLHKAFGIVSDEAIEKGVTVRMMLEKLPDADIPVSPAVVKEIWRIFQRNITGKASTTELTTKEIDQVFEPFSKFLAEEFDIVLDFPSIETLMNNQRGKRTR